MVEGYAGAMGLPIGNEALRAQAVEWSVTRGARSGRVAWQFIQDLAGGWGWPGLNRTKPIRSLQGLKLYPVTQRPGLRGIRGVYSASRLRAALMTSDAFIRRSLLPRSARTA